MLKSRLVTSELTGASLTVKADRGCPQGVVLSPLIWTVIRHEPLAKLNDLGIEPRGYVDDLAISVVGWPEQTITERMHKTLSITHKWCKDKGLHINPRKTVLVLS